MKDSWLLRWFHVRPVPLDPPWSDGYSRLDRMDGLGRGRHVDPDRPVDKAGWPTLRPRHLAEPTLAAAGAR